MQEIGRSILFFGIILVLLGLILTIGPKIPFLGKLPGDIFIKRDNFSFYFPLVTSVVISIILTIIVNLFTRK